MVTYPLNELQPGMIVAADVFTPRGQLIVLRGSILSQQMIQHMKYYHVPSVTILPNEIDPMSLEKADRSDLRQTYPPERIFQRIQGALYAECQHFSGTVESFCCRRCASGYVCPFTGHAGTFRPQSCFLFLTGYAAQYA